MSEWDDLGARDKPVEKAAIYKNLKPPPVYHHEAEEITAKRKAKNLGAIFSIIPDAKIEELGLVRGRVKGREFEFWPATDCWYSHAKQKHGNGIEELCLQIKRNLIENPNQGDLNESTTNPN